MHASSRGTQVMGWEGGLLGEGRASTCMRAGPRVLCGEKWGQGRPAGLPAACCHHLPAFIHLMLHIQRCCRIARPSHWPHSAAGTVARGWAVQGQGVCVCVWGGQHVPTACARVCVVCATHACARVHACELCIHNMDWLARAGAQGETANPGRPGSRGQGCPVSRHAHAVSAAGTAWPTLRAAACWSDTAYDSA